MSSRLSASFNKPLLQSYISPLSRSTVMYFHMIQAANTARVSLADQSTWDARLVGVAPDKDLAVLKIDAPRSRLHPIRVGTSRDLAVGQKVFAIGSPFGFDQALTTGVI